MEVCLLLLFIIYYIFIPPLMLVFMIWSNQTPGPDEALHRLRDAVLESMVVFRMASRAVTEVVVPLSFAEACFFPRRPVVLGVSAAAE